MKDNTMGGITEEGGAGLTIEQNACVALDAQIDVQIGLDGDPPHQRLGPLPDDSGQFNRFGLSLSLCFVLQM